MENTNNIYKHFVTREIMNTLRILLVEDNLQFRNSAIRFINRSLKFEQLTWASSGEEALAKINQYNPTLILMDLSLPGISGFQAIKKIRSFNKNIKIIILTMSKGSEYHGEAIAVGADGFITKSELGSSLPEKLKELFGKEIIRSSK